MDEVAGVAGPQSRHRHNHRRRSKKTVADVSQG